MIKKYFGSTVIIFLLLFIVSFGNAETFGSPEDNPKPVIQEIEIHDVTNVEDKETAENLEDSIEANSEGLETLEAKKQDETREYRFDFIIQNEGEVDWEITNSDVLSHQGLGTNWEIENIEENAWYQIEDEDKRRGASIEDDLLEWTTSNQGNLAQNEIMVASYIFETSIEETEKFEEQSFNVEAEINDEENTGSEISHNTELIKLGNLNVELNEPPQDTRLQSNKEFVVNGTVTCENGECGDVTSVTRYNQTDTMVPISNDENEEPFYIIGEESERSCYDLVDECVVEWSVNATGEIDSRHELDIESESSFEDISGAESSNNEVSIDYFLIVRDNRDTTTFGAVNVGTFNNPARSNLEEPVHEITVDEYSQPVDEMYLRATNLSSYHIEGYHVSPDNIYYNFENNTETHEPMSKDYEIIKTDIMPGETLQMFYWLDVPTGIVQDYYNGTKTFLAASEP